MATTSEFDAWFSSLPNQGKVELLAKVELLKEYGPHLGRPHADTLKGSEFANMKELRGKTSDAVLRVAFAFDTHRQGILLVGGNKGGVNQQRFYRQLVAAADKLFAIHLRKF